MYIFFKRNPKAQQLEIEKNKAKLTIYKMETIEEKIPLSKKEKYIVLKLFKC
jgi:hypothetical protein